MTLEECYSAIFALSFLAYINVLNALMVIELSIGIPRILDVPTVYMLGPLFALILIHYLALIHGGRAERILRDTCRGSRRGVLSAAGTWAYPIGSLIIFFILVTTRGT